MKYNHIILCKLHLLLCQNVEILQTHIVLLIEETLLLDTCHVEHIKLSHGILELFYLLELYIVGTKHIIAQKNPFFHPTMLFRRAVLESVNGYSTSPETRRTEDYDLVMRLAANGVIGENLQEILYSVYEPQEAYLRHNARTRMYEVRVRARGLRAMGSPASDYIYLVKPLIMACVPRGMMRSVKRLQWKLQSRDTKK